MDSGHSSLLRVVTQHPHWGGGERCATTLKTAAKVGIVKFVKYSSARENSPHFPPPVTFLASGNFHPRLDVSFAQLSLRQNRDYSWLLEVEGSLSRHKMRSIAFAATFLLIVLNLFCLFCSVKSRMLVKFCLQNCHP